MKYSRRKRFSKLPPVKRELGKLNLFHHKRNKLKLHTSHSESKQSRQPNFVIGRNADFQAKPFSSKTGNHKSDGREEKIPRNWWIHLWQGLVVDKTAKHHKAMRQAVWLYLYFLVTANWKTGVLYRRISTITSETGFNRRSIERWLKLLREKGYIKTYSTGRALQISITKWKPISPRKITKETADNQE